MADLPVPVTAADEVRRITQDVLARPEFIESRPSWLQRAWLWLADRIGSLLDALGGEGRGSTIGTVALVVIIVVAILVVLRFSRTVRRDRRLDLEAQGTVGRSPQDWLDEAAALEQQAQWRAALRCRYRGLVAELAEHGLVEEVPGRTTGEYLTAVVTNVPDAAEAFTAATRGFEVAWYGHADVTASDAEDFAAVARRVLAAAGVRRPVAAAAS